MSAYLPPTLNNGILNNVYNPADYGSASSGFLKLSGGTVTGDLTLSGTVDATQLTASDLTVSGDIDTSDLNSSGTVRLNSITLLYTSLPTFTGSQIGYTIQKVLSTENTYYTGIRNVPTGADTLNVPIGVYLVNHTFQLNVTINNTKRKNVTLYGVSGISIIGYSHGEEYANWGVDDGYMESIISTEINKLHQS